MLQVQVVKMPFQEIIVKKYTSGAETFKNIVGRSTHPIGVVVLLYVN